METKVWNIAESTPEQAERAVAEAAALLREGGVVAFPTETVYGLGADAANREAVAKIFAAKGRPQDNPLIVHIADPAQAEALAAEVGPVERELMARFWPGPLTLVLPARPGPWWDNVRIGMGPPPVLTTHGWLAVYHGIKSVAGGLVYRAGLALLDAERPERVLRRTDEWVFSPVEPYERTGDAPNVVFPTGLVHDVEQDRLRLYYGAADTCVGLASASYSEVVDFLLTCPAPEPSGA